MKRFNFNKPMVESPIPPTRTDVLWVDIDENTNKVKSIKEFKDNKWQDIVSGGGSGEYDSVSFKIFLKTAHEIEILDSSVKRFIETSWEKILEPVIYPDLITKYFRVPVIFYTYLPGTSYIIPVQALTGDTESSNEERICMSCKQGSDDYFYFFYYTKTGIWEGYHNDEKITI